MIEKTNHERAGHDEAPVDAAAKAQLTILRSFEGRKILFAWSWRSVYRISMPTVAIPAHFDGKQIVLDEPFDLPINAHLLVTLLPSSDHEENEDIWLKAAARSDAFAFLTNDAEDIYTPADGEAFESPK